MPKLIKPRKHAYQRHACRQCTAVFVEASHLGTHVRTIHSTTHTRSPPRILLSNSPTDRGHARTVHGEASTLTAHVRAVREKRRDHACPHCAAAFGTAQHLTTHVRTVHEKRREHTCPHCAAAFGTAGHLATMCAQCTMWVRQLSNDVGEGESE